MRTFDGKFYDMRGECGYVLSKHCHFPKGVKQKYEIRFLNKNCVSSSGGLTSCEKQLEVSIRGEQIITLNPGRSNTAYEPTVKVGGKEVSQYFTSDLGVSVNYHGGRNIVVKSRKAGITILWTGHNMFLTVSSSMFKQTCGLCGTFDGDTSNDFHTHDDDTEILASSFALQWKVNSGELSSPECHNGKWESFEKPCDLYSSNKRFAEQKCAVVKDTNGPFRLCHKFLSPENYYSNCLADGCTCVSCFARVVEAYVKECADKGVYVKWTNNAVVKRQEGKFRKTEKSVQNSTSLWIQKEFLLQISLDFLNNTQRTGGISSVFLS